MRHALAALLLLAPALAGCVAPAVVDAPAEGTPAAGGLPPGVGLLPDGTPPPLNLLFTGCTEHAAIFPVPMAEAEEWMPEGFTPQPFDPLGTLASVVVFTHTCGFEGEESAKMLSVTPVEPPAHLRGDGASRHHILHGGFVDDRGVADVLTAWGLPEVRAGEVELRHTVELNGMRRMGHAMASGDGFGVQFEADANGETGRWPAGTSRAFGVEDRRVVGVVEWDYTEVSVMSNGRSTLTGEGLPPLSGAPASGGSGIHLWGFDFDLRYVPLDVEAVGGERGGG